MPLTLAKKKHDCFDDNGRLLSINLPIKLTYWTAFLPATPTHGKEETHNPP
jgi:hypothetical protein